MIILTYVRTKYSFNPTELFLVEIIPPNQFFRAKNKELPNPRDQDQRPARVITLHFPR